jgi:dTDP-glucose 4,6-dehydratase
VTGGAGFLGSHVVDALVKRGESVVVFDNLTTGRLGNLENAIASGRVTFVYADTGIDSESLRSIIAESGATQVRAIFHFGTQAEATPSMQPPDNDFSAQGLGTAPLIDVALEKRARFVHSSVVEVAAVDLGGNPRDDDPARSEQREAAVTSAAGERGLDARIVRLFNCYGPRMSSVDGSLIPTLFDAVVNNRSITIEGTGDETRCLTYIDDAVELLMKVSEQKETPVAPLDIANHESYSVNHIAKSLANVARTDFSLGFVPGRGREDRRPSPDITRAHAMGWRPRTSLRDGLRSTYQWFLRDRQLFV